MTNSSFHAEQICNAITILYIHAKKEVDRGSQRGGREVKKKSTEVEKRSTEVERWRGTPFERVRERVRE